MNSQKSVWVPNWVCAALRSNNILFINLFFLGLNKKFYALCHVLKPFLNDGVAGNITQYFQVFGIIAAITLNTQSAMIWYMI